MELLKEKEEFVILLILLFWSYYIISISGIANKLSSLLLFSLLFTATVKHVLDG